MIDFNFENIKQHDSVLVLGGGPSLTNEFHLIEKFIKNENPIIISANYEHQNINIDYIHFVTSSKFLEAKNNNITTKNIIFRDKIADLHIEIPDKICYKIGNNHSDSGAYKIKNIKQDEYGNFNLGNAGFSSIIISSVFKPKKIFIIGFDGPFKDFSKKLTYKNEIKYYNKSFIETNGLIKKNYFTNVIIPFLLSKNIKIYSSKKDNLWGIPKDNIKIYG
jgi:hypothetical protein